MTNLDDTLLGISNSNRRVQHVLTCTLICTFVCGMVVGGLFVHGLWLQHHGDGHCYPVPVIGDNEMAEILMEINP